MADQRLMPQELVPQIGQNGSAAQKKEDHQYHHTPADGGSRAWAVMLGSFFCNGILFGVINSYGVLYSEFHDNLQRKNVTNAAGKAGNFFIFSISRDPIWSFQFLLFNKVTNYF